MTTQQPEALPALIERFRGLHFDHAPDGWPAVRTREITALLDRITELESQLAQRFDAADVATAAQAVVDRWDTPLWKDVPSTAEYIGRLRAALAAGQATAGQPAAPKNLWLGALDIRMAQGCGLKGDRLPVLYTDTVNGAGVCRDDLWLCTSEALKPAEPVAEPADTVVLNAAMRAIQQAIELIGAPTDERMRAVRRVLRGAVIVAEDAGKVAPMPGTAYAALPESFLEIPDVQDESGINAYYSREAVLECIDAALASHGQAPAEPEGISRDDWIEQAVRVYLIAGDTYEQAQECAAYLWGELDMDDLADPYDAAMSDIEGRNMPRKETQ